MKKIWISLSTIGLTLGMAVAGLVGAGNISSAKAADDGHTWGIIGAFTGNSWSSDVATSTYDSVSDKHIVSYTITEGTKFKIRADGDWTFSIGGSVLTNSLVTDGSTYFSADGENAVVNTGKGGYFTFKLDGGYYGYTDHNYGVSFTYEAPTPYTVTEYAVLGTTVQSEILQTETAYSTSSFTPSNVLVSGYYRVGWYTDSACTTAYTATTLSAATTLYCKYAAVTSSVSYAYFSVDGWSDVHAYIYGGQNQLGSWNGAVCEATNGATFFNYVEGAYTRVGGIYRIGFHSEYLDTKIIFNGTETSTSLAKQTNDLTLTAGALYFSGDAADTAGSTDKGAAAKVIFDINTARNAVAANGTIAVDSLCGINSTDATTLVGEYDALTEAQKPFVDNSLDYTYDGIDTSTSVDVSYTAIIAQLRLIAAGGSPRNNMNSLANNSNVLVIVVISCLLAIGGVSFYLLRKKKVTK